MYDLTYNFIEVYSKGSNFNIGSDDGLAPTRRQAIIWPMLDSLVTNICVNRP